MNPTDTLRKLIAACEAQELPAARDLVGALIEHDRHYTQRPVWPVLTGSCTGLAAFELGVLCTALSHQWYYPDEASTHYRIALRSLGHALGVK